MPFIASSSPARTDVTADEPDGDPSLSQMVGAAARSTSIGAALTALPRFAERGDFDPGFDPYALGDPDVERRPDLFVDTRNAADFERLKAKIAGEDRAGEIRRMSPWSMGALDLLFGVLDPINAVPVLGTGMRAATVAGRVARGVGIGVQGAALQEGVLQGAQDTRTAADAALTVAAGGVIGGAIGAAAPLISRAVRGAMPSGRSMRSNAAAVQQVLADAGYTPEAQAGILGNLRQESGINPRVAPGDSGTAFGIAQWRHDRADALRAFAARHNLDWQGIEAQRRFLVQEISQHPGLPARLNAASSPEQAAEIFAREFERPAVIDPSRARYAREYYGKGTGPTTDVDDLIADIKRDIDPALAERTPDDWREGILEAGEISSVSAAQTRNQSMEDLRLVAEPVIRPFARMPIFASADLPLRVSPSREARLVGQELSESHLLTRGNIAGVPVAQSVEGAKRQWLGGQIMASAETEGFYRSYRKAAKGEPDRLDRTQFNEAVGMAMRRNDDARDLPIPQSARAHVSRAAATQRRLAIGPLGAEAMKDGPGGRALISQENVESAATTADSYLMRLYDKGHIRETRVRFRDVLFRGASDVRARDTQRAEAVSAAGRSGTEKMEGMVRRFRAEQPDLVRDAVAPNAAEMAEWLLRSLKDRAGRLSPADQTIVDEAAAALGKARAGRNASRLALRLQEVATRNGVKIPTGADRPIAEQAARIVAALADAAKTDQNLASVAAEAQQLLRDAAAAVARADKQEAGSLAGYSDQELVAMVEDIIDRILGDGSGRSGVDLTLAERGPAKERTLRFVSDVDIEEWLVSDVRKVVPAYVRSLSADVELFKRYGTVTGESAIERIRDDYRRLALGRSADEQQRLNGRMNEDIDRARGLIDQLRGTYWMPRSPNDVLLADAASVAKAIQVTLKLGQIIPSSLNDLFRPIFTHGVMRTFGDGIMPLIRSFELARLTRDVAREAGTAAETAGASLQLRLAELSSEYGEQSRLQRLAQLGAGTMFRVTGFDHFNEWNKVFSAVITQSRMIKAIEAVATGGKVRDTEVARLGRLGIGRDEAAAIWRQLEKNGSELNGARFADPRKWDDPRARQTYLAAVGQEVDETIVSPGLDKPFWMAQPLGSVIGQFRSFSMASLQRTLLAGIQRGALGDMSLVAGAVTAVGAGMIGYAIKEVLAGRDLKPDPEWWVWNGVEQSGLLSFIGDVNRSIEAMSRGGLGVRAMMGRPPRGKFDAAAVTSGVLGPTFGTIENAGRAMAAMLVGDMSRSDIARARSLVPFNNLIWWRWAFDEAEKGVGSALGLPQKRKLP